VRADQLIEQKLDIQADGLSAKDLTRLITKNKVGCPECKGTLGEGKQFNLMFSTLVGPVADEKARSYLRPETAQLIFTNFRYVTEHARLKVPFGIAQIGKAFRNEISPRDFLFRCRELEQMELEYFIHPSMIKNCPFLKEVEKHKILVYSAGMQDKKQNPKEMTMKDAVGKKLLMPWHAYWLTLSHQWFVDLGAIPKNFRIRQHLAKEKSHYAIDTWDLEYKFPFGWKELQGMANRTDFDLKQHAEHSKTDLSLYDEESKKKFFPHVVAEPAQGVERAMLVFLFDAYHNDKKRGNIVLKLHPLLAPVKVGVFPLTNKIKDQAKKVYDKLKQDFHCTFDRSGSVGRRYARADETGIPLCVTFDFESLKDKAVTLRDRDTTKQVRVPLAELPERIALFLMGKKGKGWK
jgi:glycyl-tRNA synthetase